LDLFSKPDKAIYNGGLKFTPPFGPIIDSTRYAYIRPAGQRDVSDQELGPPEWGALHVSLGTKLSLQHSTSSVFTSAVVSIRVLYRC
jgi:hypothetical protein